jgi:hypothetical protein
MLVNVGVRGCNFMLSWVTYSGGTVDPGTRAIIGGTAIPQTGGPYQGLVHLAEAKSVLRQYVEIEVGDMIVDFPPYVPIDGLQNLRFTMLDQNGNPLPDQVYEQKEIGGKLAKAWDAIVAGNPTLRTVLLKKAT